MYLVPVLYLLTSIVALGFSINAKVVSPSIGIPIWMMTPVFIFAGIDILGILIDRAMKIVKYRTISTFLHLIGDIGFSIMTLMMVITVTMIAAARSSELKYDYPTLTLFYGIFCIIAFVRNFVGSFWECGCYDYRLVCGRNLTDDMDDDEEGHYNATSTRCFGRSNDGLTYSSNSNKMNYSQFIRPDFLILGVASIVSSYQLEQFSRTSNTNDIRDTSNVLMACFVASMCSVLTTCICNYCGYRKIGMAVGQLVMFMETMKQIVFGLTIGFIWQLSLHPIQMTVFDYAIVFSVILIVFNIGYIICTRKVIDAVLS